MRLRAKIERLERVEEAIEAAETYLAGKRMIALRLNCPTLFRYRREKDLRDAEVFLRDCAKSCKCPLCIAYREVREAFGTAPPDEWYALDKNWREVASSLSGIVDRERTKVDTWGIE